MLSHSDLWPVMDQQLNDRDRRIVQEAIRVLSGVTGSSSSTHASPSVSDTPENTHSASTPNVPGTSTQRNPGEQEGSGTFTCCIT